MGFHLLSHTIDNQYLPLSPDRSPAGVPICFITKYPFLGLGAPRPVAAVVFVPGNRLEDLHHQIGCRRSSFLSAECWQQCARWNGSSGSLCQRLYEMLLAAFPLIQVTQT